MIIRKLLLAAASIAALAPAISHASTEKAALKACARAFASSIAPPGSSPPAYKLKYDSNQFVSVLQYYAAREYTFYLEANDPKTGVRLARATCSTDTRGAVVALTPTPLDTPALAAQF